MPDPSLAGVDAKLARAREHLGALYAEVNAFQGREPHELVKDFDPQTRTFRMTMKVREHPDELRWGLLLGDFAHNLHSALDQLIWQLVLLNGAKPVPENQFPIAMGGPQYWCAPKDEGKSKSLRERRLKGVADSHRAAIDAAQPYRAGALRKQHPLAVVADLSNTDKHRFLHPAFIAVEEPTTDDFTVISSDDNAAAKITFNSGRLEDGAEVLGATFSTDDPNAKVTMHASVPIAIAFGEDWPVKSESLSPVVERYVVELVESFRPDFP